VWREVVGTLPEPPPPYTPDWAEAMGRETFAEAARRHMVEIAPAEARAGDVVLFRWRAHLPAKHAGILTGPETMIHAQERAAVAEVAVSAWWRRRVAYAFAFPGLARRGDIALRESCAGSRISGCGFAAPGPG
jgi:NlpC/P60 family putative phage cell wall peptidase